MNLYDEACLECSKVVTLKYSTSFPGINFENFSEADKRQIELDVKADFEDAYIGIKQLPQGALLGVYIAYKYYLQLLRKISGTPTQTLLQKRVSVSDAHKLSLYCRAFIQQKLNFV